MSGPAESESDDAVAALLREHVNTLEKLELVVTLGRDPNISWSLDGLSAALRIPAVHLVPAIDKLRAAGILHRVPGATYALVYYPIQARAAACAALCRAYEDNRNAILRLLREIELERATRSSADAFADAFLIRRPIPESTDE